jgi:formate dehydrogenase subunit gamma
MATIRTATERAAKAARSEPGVVRYNRPARWLHAALYLATTALLVTGWWLRTGHEGEPSVLAELFDSPDTDVHETAGWVLLGIGMAGPLLGIRATITFLRETFRVDRGDGAWFWRWPRGAVTGRFGRHRGHFDPGQRIANVAFVATLGGSTFATMVRVHRVATYVLTALVAGHLVITLGLLPGYRGVWRAMHFRGWVPDATARRVWPASVASDRRSEATQEL